MLDVLYDWVFVKLFGERAYVALGLVILVVLAVVGIVKLV